MQFAVFLYRFLWNFVFVWEADITVFANLILEVEVSVQSYKCQVEAKIRTKTCHNTCQKMDRSYYYTCISQRWHFKAESFLNLKNQITSRKLLRIKVTPDLHLTYSKNGGNLGLVLKMNNITCLSILLTKHVKYTYLYLFKFILYSIVAFKAN